MVGAVPSSAHVIVRDEPPAICAPAAGEENLTSAMAVAARVASTVKMWQRIVCVYCVLCILGRAVLRVVGLGNVSVRTWTVGLGGRCDEGSGG
jgi:hypothetical protein